MRPSRDYQGIIDDLREDLVDELASAEPAQLDDMRERAKRIQRMQRVLARHRTIGGWILGDPVFFSPGCPKFLGGARWVGILTKVDTQSGDVYIDYDDGEEVQDYSTRLGGISGVGERTLEEWQRERARRGHEPWRDLFTREGCI